MSKILITGGAGFVGYHLAKKLSEDKNEIVIVDNFSRGRKDTELTELTELIARPNMKVIETDLTEKNSWSKIGSGFDYIYHLTSINGFKSFIEIPHEVLRVGITSTLNALEWLRSENNKPGAKILFTSSNEVYMGATESFGQLPIPTPENIPAVIPDAYNPRWSYAGQKLINEMLFIHYAKAYDLRMVIVRPHNIFGPRSGYDSMIPKIIERMEKRTEPFPIFDPKENRSSCYIDDVISGMIKAIESEKTDGGTYNIGSPTETTVKDLIEIMFDIAKWHPKEFAIKESPTSSSLHCLPDISKLENDTGWETKTTLKEGLEKTMEWYAKNPKN